MTRSARALITLVFALASLWAQDTQVNFTVRGRWPCYKSGPAQAVAVQGHYAYVGIAAGAGGRDGGILIFDVTNPAKPVWRSAFEAGRPVTSLAVVGNLLYAARGDAGLVSWGGIAVTGHYAYVMESKIGLVVLDVSDPTNSTLVGFSSASCGEIQLAGNHA